MPSEELVHKAREIAAAFYGPMEGQELGRLTKRIATALESADASGYARGRAEAVEEWPAWSEYAYGEPVEKFTGEARWNGRVVSAYLTTRGKQRYVVDVEPQGFQMIAVPTQLRALSQKDMRHEV